jgi:F0F1-type ATP synthase beta subunit
LARSQRERGLKLQNHFIQPFGVAEPYTGQPGATGG